MSNDFAVIEEESKIDIKDEENEQIYIDGEENNQKEVEEGEEREESENEDKEKEVNISCVDMQDDNTTNQEENSEDVNNSKTGDWSCEEKIEEGCVIQIINNVDDDDKEDKINFFQLLKDDDEKMKV